MKKLLLIILLLSSLPIAYGIDLCGDTVNINTSCLMITPTLTTCGDYEYRILNDTGGIIEASNMTYIGNNIYNFTFIQEEGEYLILLCDGTTKEIQVEGDTMLNDLVIVFLLLVVGIGFAVFGEFIKNTVFHIFGAVWLLAAAPLITTKLTLLSGFMEYLSIGFFVLIGMVLIAIAMDERYKNKDAQEDY